MKSINKIRKLFVLLFCVFIASSGVMKILNIDFKDELSENRKKQEKPVFEALDFHKPTTTYYRIKGLDGDLKTFIESFNAYFNDSFKARNLLLRVFRLVKIKILKTSPIPEKVVFGKNGWLFYGDSDGQALSESIGLVRFTENDLISISSKILLRKHYLDSLGIKYYVAIAPNKHTVYQEFIPIKSKNSKTKLNDLKAYMLNNYDFEIIDLKEYFPDYKNNILFNKTGTHWNDFGAYLGYSRLMDDIKRDYPDLEKVSINEYKIDTVVDYKKSLSRMLNYPFEEYSIQFSPLFSEDTVLVRYNDYYKVYNGGRDLKVLFFRDSFCSAMVKYFQASFGESTFVWTPYIEKHIVEKEKPDIVIHEVAERYIDVLNYYIKP